MTLSLFDPRVLLGLVVAFLISNSVTGGLLYFRGRDDMKAFYTTQELANANKALARTKGTQDRATQAAQDHNNHETQVIHDTRTILKTVTIPPDSDPFVPVWFVRLHDRSASRWAGGDPYPGKSDGEPSDVRLSQAIAMLAANYEGCEVNRSRITDIIAIKPVMPAVPTVAPERGLLDRINPFN